MKKIKRMLKIHRIFMAQEFKRMMEYKGDFIVGVIGFFLVQLSNLMFLWIIFGQIPNLAGWSVNEVVFIYGLSLIPKGIDHFFFDNLWSIGYFTVRKGDFDKYLTRPVNTLFHVLVEKIQIDALGEFIMGVALVCASVPNLHTEWDVFRILAMIFMIPFITLIFTGVKTITASVAFWTKRSGNVIYMFYTLSPVAKGYLIWMLVFSCFYMFAFAYNTIFTCGVFPAGGDAKYDAVSVIFATWCFAIPAALIACFVLKLPKVELGGYL